MEKDLQKFTFKVKDLSGLNLSSDRLDEITVQITAKNLREAQDNIRDYLAKGYFKAERVILEKIEI